MEQRSDEETARILAHFSEATTVHRLDSIMKYLSVTHNPVQLMVATGLGRGLRFAPKPATEG